MFRLHPKPQTNRLEPVRTGRVLPAGHRRSQIVRYDDGNLRLVVYGIQQPRHARMGERGIADDSDGRKHTGVGRPFGHRNGSPHVEASVYGTERRQSP